MTGRVSSAAWLKRLSAMRRSSPGRRNGAGVATRSCTVLPPLALAGSLTLAGSITAHHRADQQLVDPPDIFWAADRQTAQMKAPGRKGIAEPMPHHDRGGDDP